MANLMRAYGRIQSGQEDELAYYRTSWLTFMQKSDSCNSAAKAGHFVSSWCPLFALQDICTNTREDHQDPDNHNHLCILPIHVCIITTPHLC